MRPNSVPNRESVTFVSPPENRFVDGVLVEFALRPVVRVGAQKPRDCAISTSWICGLMRSTWSPRFCSRAKRTASSTESCRIGPDGRACDGVTV